jgi:hypothetical protein
MWAVIFGLSFLMAAGFLFVLLRGLRTGVMPLYRGPPYRRDQNPTGFRIAAIGNAIAILVLAMTPIYLALKQYLESQ